MIAAKCPDLNCLHDYLAGRLDDTTAAELERHLDECETCERTLCELEQEPDSLVGILRGGQPGGVATLSPQVLSAQEFAKSLPHRLRPVASVPSGAATIGAYQLLRLLGQGGMGTVYLARHRKLDKQVALKLLPTFSGQRQEAIARFQREMRTAGKLDHPAIVRATDAGEADGVHYLVMDAIDGLDVGKICKTAGPLSVADACEIARQGAIGLAYAHSQGIVHRDVKPSNLMLDRGGQVKILDFGLAQLEIRTDESASLTGAGQLMGTLDYMAPEQAEGIETPDHRADIYALGATLYRLLGNRPPLSAERGISPLEKLRLIAAADPAPIETLRGDVPAELARLVMQMLARDPAQRPLSATEAAERLAPFCAGADLMKLLAAAEEACPVEPESLGGAPATSDPRNVAVTHSPSRGSKGGGRIWLALAGVLLLGAGILIAREMSQGPSVNKPQAAATVGDAPPPAIKLGEVQRQSVVIEQQYVCVIDADHVAEIQAPDDGLLEKSRIDAGQRVKQGEALFQFAPAIDPKEGEELRETITVLLNAPFDGVFSQPRSPGAVKQGETVAVLIDDSVMRVDFNVPEARVQPLQQKFAKLNAPKLQLRLANGRTFDQVGKLAGVGPDANPQTGNVTFRANFPNPQGLLRRGQTGVAVIIDSVPDAITVPQQATFEKGGKHYLFVVDRQNVPHLREIVIDSELKDRFLIRSGVAAHETIVTEGVREVRDGEPIE